MEEINIKRYCHFDAPLTKLEAQELLSDPDLISRHAFYPFIQRHKRWTKFERKNRIKEDKHKPKDRELRRASRRDSCIFAHYRTILKQPYEEELKRRSLTECVIAYRKIPVTGGKGNKCNIHFADDAFRIIRKLGNCYVIALDIHHFFENLDHERIKQNWIRLLGPSPTKCLPPDHYAVFRAITKYSFVEENSLYQKLGIIGTSIAPDGKQRIRYIVHRGELKKREKLCTSSDFRAKVCPLIKVNCKSNGIPQGSPISDLLANLYMLDTDEKLNSLAKSMKGVYFRYSDDILIAVPSNGVQYQGILDSVKSILSATAPNLQLNEEKTQICEYTRTPETKDQMACNVLKKLKDNKSDISGIEYLGFRYDGKKIYLRNSTISGFKRKITMQSKRIARDYVLFHPQMSQDELIRSFDYESLINKFGRKRDFDPHHCSYHKWTFWTYAQRAVGILGKLGEPIRLQINSYKSFARSCVVQTIKKTYSACQIIPSSPSN